MAEVMGSKMKENYLCNTGKIMMMLQEYINQILKKKKSLAIH